MTMQTTIVVIGSLRVNAYQVSMLDKIVSIRLFEISFLFVPENRIWLFMQIVSSP